MTEELLQPNSAHQGGQRKATVTHTPYKNTHPGLWPASESRQRQKHSRNLSAWDFSTMQREHKTHKQQIMSRESFQFKIWFSAQSSLQGAIKIKVTSLCFTDAAVYVGVSLWEITMTIMESEARTFPHTHTWRSHFYWHNTSKGRPGWRHLVHLWRAKSDGKELLTVRIISIL